MPKISISLPQDIIVALERAVQEARISRSAFIEMAVKHYLEGKDRERKITKQKEAAAAMDKFREEYGGWDGTAEILYWRDRHQPQWLVC